MTYSGEQYLKMTSDLLPYTTKWGFTIGGLSVQCPTCQNETDNTKYKFNEFSNALDVIAVGICDNCKVIVTSKPMRVYRDDRISWQEEDGQWITNYMKYSGICGWFKNIINFFKVSK